MRAADAQQLRSRHAGLARARSPPPAILQHTAYAREAMRERMSAPDATDDSDEARFERFLLRHQHPPNCTAARLYLWKGARYGFGAQMRVMANSFLDALMQGRTFVASHVTTQWIGARACTSQSWECSFLPLTWCTALHAFELGVLPASSPPPPARVRGRASVKLPSRIDAAEIIMCPKGHINAGAACDRAVIGRTSCSRFDVVCSPVQICKMRCYK